MITPYDWSNRLDKDTVRTELFEYIKTRFGTLTGYLCLPGWDGSVGGIDVHRGLNLGAITPDTKVIGFEYRKDWAAAIRKHFKSMPNVKIESGMIEDSKLEPNSIDFGFLDFTGTVNYKLYQWLGSGFASSLKPGASFAITLSFGRREGNLFHQTKQRLSTDLKGYRSTLAKRFPSIWYDQPTIATWLFILKCALRNYHNTLRDVLIYDDRTPMIVFLFEDVRPLDGAGRQYPELVLRKEERSKAEPILRKENPMTKSTKATRTKAALKAHATRRTNAAALAEKRSASARKAWVTRRAQA
jgi:hypothetical protein